MTIVKELVLACDPDVIMQVLRNRYDDPENDPMFHRDQWAYTRAMLRARYIEPVSTPDYIMFAVPAYCNGKERISADLVKKSDIDDFAAGRIPTKDDPYSAVGNCWNWDDSLTGLEPSVDMPPELVDKLCDCGWHLNTYGYDFDSWETILGYEVDLPSVEKCGTAAFIADVLEEMTFLSWDEDERREEAEELHRRIDEVNEAVESGDMSHFVSWDEFCEEFDIHDTRTETEIEAERVQNRRECAYCMLSLHNVIMRYLSTR